MKGTRVHTMSAVVGQADVVGVLLGEGRVVDDLRVRFGDDIGGHHGRHDDWISDREVLSW